MTSGKAKFTGPLLVAALVGLLVLFQAGARYYPPKFVDFQRLEWQQSPTCLITKALTVEDSEKAERFSNSQSVANQKGCQTLPFNLQTGILQIDVRPATSENPPDTVQLETSNSQDPTKLDVRQFALYQQGPQRGWDKYRVDAGTAAVGSRAVIRIVPQSTPNKQVWKTIRKRLSFYQRPSRIARFFRIFSRSPLQPIVCLLLAVVLALWMLASAGNKGSLWIQGISFFVIAFLVHYRADAFFYYDEMHVIMRFGKLGATTFLDSHNEHFLPLFFLVYYLETLLFSDHYLGYLSLSLVIHTLNALLLEALLRRLAGERQSAPAASRVLALLYLISSLHTEVLHWAFTISVVMLQTVILSTLIFSWDFVQNGPKRLAVLAWWGCFLGPLLFGCGFMLGQLVSGTAVICALFGKNLLSKAELWLRLKRVFCLLAGAVLFVGATALLYWLYREGIGHTLDQARPFENLSALGRYLIVGTGLGTIVRGLGLYPTLQPLDTPLVGVEFFGPQPTALLGFGAIGFFLALLCLLSLFWSKKRLLDLCTWALGLGWIAAMLFLPGLGRWSFGELQALSLRYHSFCAAGLWVMMLGVMLVVLEKGKRFFSSEASLLQRLSGAALVILLALHIFMQLNLGLSYRVFPEFGVRHRDFFAELHHWNHRLREMTNAQYIAFDAPGTPLAGLEPLLEQSITPERDADQIYAAFNWLSPKRYPIRTDPFEK